MNRKRIILVTAVLLPILVLGACGKRSDLKRVREQGVAVPAVMPSVRGTTTTKSQQKAPMIPAAVMPGAVLPDPDPFGTRQ